MKRTSSKVIYWARQ